MAEKGWFRMGLVTIFHEKLSSVTQIIDIFSCTRKYLALQGILACQAVFRSSREDLGDSWVFLGTPEGLAVQKMLDFTFIV
jgi:hypothetical protein